MVKRDISNIKLPSLLLSDTFSVNTWTMISLGLMVYQDIIQTDCALNFLFLSDTDTCIKEASGQ